MLFTIIVIDNDDYLQTRFIRLYLVGELTNIDGIEYSMRPKPKASIPTTALNEANNTLATIPMILV